MVHNSNSGRIYGSEPKCVRVREMHGLLFYLVYGYTGVDGRDQAQAKEMLKKDNSNLTDQILANVPPIFQVLPVVHICTQTDQQFVFELEP